MLEENLDKLREKYERDPDSLIFAQYGDTLRKANRIDEAITILEDGLRKHPNYATGYMILGRCYRDKNAIEAAIKEFEKAVELDKQSILAHKELSDLYIQEGQTNRAIDILQKLLNLDPLDDAARDKLRELREKSLEEEKNVISSVGKEDFFSFFEEEKTKESMEVPTETEVPKETHKKNIPEEELESFLEPKRVPEQPAEAETPTEETPPVEETREEVEPVSAQPIEKGTEEFETKEIGAESVEKEMAELPEKKIKKETIEVPQGSETINPKFNLELAKLYIKYNFNDKALSVLQKILEKEPDNTDASLLLNEIKGLSPLEEIKKPSPPMEEEKTEDTGILEEIGKKETPIEIESAEPEAKEEDTEKKEENKRGTENAEPKSLSDLFGEDENE